jgi:hypothetical protein
MKVINQVEDEAPETSEESRTADRAPSLAQTRTVPRAGGVFSGAVVAELIGMDQEGRAPLVLYPGQPSTAAVAARSIVDLHRGHIGRQVLLMLDDSAGGAPIVVGLLREDDASSRSEAALPVAIEVDGDRVLVSGERQIVLRCGKASITLTREGKILIFGTYLSCHSSGVNRIKGGSVEIN